MMLAENVRFDDKSTHYEVLSSDLGVWWNNVVLIEIAAQSYSLKKRGWKERAGVPRKLSHSYVVKWPAHAENPSSNENSKWWKQQVMETASDKKGKWWERQVMRTASDKNGKWWERQVMKPASDDYGKWWQRQVMRVASDEHGKWWKR